MVFLHFGTGLGKSGKVAGIGRIWRSGWVAPEGAGHPYGDLGGPLAVAGEHGQRRGARIDLEELVAALQRKPVAQHVAQRAADVAPHRKPPGGRISMEPMAGAPRMAPTAAMVGMPTNMDSGPATFSNIGETPGCRRHSSAKARVRPR